MWVGLPIFVLLMSSLVLVPVFRQRKRSGREWTPREKWTLVAAVLAYDLALAAILAAFATGNPRIGIALMVAMFIVPTVVLTPLRIRRSRRVAEAERARRGPAG